jgi:hypothetical protein
MRATLKELCANRGAVRLEGSIVDPEEGGTFHMLIVASPEKE